MCLKTERQTKFVSVWKYHFFPFRSIRRDLSWSPRERIHLAGREHLPQHWTLPLFAQKVGRRQLLIEGVGKDWEEGGRGSCPAKSLTTIHQFPVPAVGHRAQQQALTRRKSSNYNQTVYFMWNSAKPWCLVFSLLFFSLFFFLLPLLECYLLSSQLF